MRFLPEEGSPRVAVIGLGYVGSCVAGTLADAGYDVIGIDINESLIREFAGGYCRFQEPGLADVVAEAAERGNVRWTTDYASVAEADVVIVAVSTPVLEGGVLSETALRSACAELALHLRPEQLVVFKSTVPPGWTRSLALPLLETEGLRAGRDFGLAFCPERLSQGNALRELRTLPVVVGGLDEASTRAAEAFWRRALGVDIITCASLEAAEVVKLASNWWIDHNIALANDLARFCEHLGVDVLDAIEATNSIPKGAGRINVLKPSTGVGGSCLTKDPWMLWSAAREYGLELNTIPTARAANDAMPGHTVDLIARELRAIGKSPAEAKVAVLGLAFKNDTGDLRATPVEHVVAGLRSLGVQLSLLDPLVDPDNAEKIFGEHPTESVEDAVRDADCLAILAWHKESESLNFEDVRKHVSRECVIIDGRAYFSKQKRLLFERLGFKYRGIGW